MNTSQLDGLYNPAYEHDACGVAFVAHLSNIPRHDVVERAVDVVCRLEHRGAEGADPDTGDGAGVLTQIPDELFQSVTDFDLPPLGQYGVGVIFFPANEERQAEFKERIETTVKSEGQKLLGWREVPVDPEHCGATANQSRPSIQQVFVGASDELTKDQDAFERKLYVIRRVVELASGPELVIPSFSSRTVVYKGMLISRQLPGFYPDLADARFKSSLGLVHSRFSTNTFPSWELAHPYRVIAHNGEINTLRGNKNWMRARESLLESDLFGSDLEKVLPVVREGGSDSATFDNVLEFLLLAGRSLPHSMMMMVPEAFEGREDMSEDLKGFYAFHSCLMEPWDGPAAVAFTDGRAIGATLDRNGLRPGRWLETEDGWVVLSSESGSMPVEETNVKRKGRLRPGNIFLVDLQQGRIIEDGEMKQDICSQKPYGKWFSDSSVKLEELPEVEPAEQPQESLRTRQLAFGYSEEDLRVLITPMAKDGQEPTGSMGNDGALAVLSDQQPALFKYFKQLFAQVTNPAVDPIRERVVMSLYTHLGSQQNTLDESPEHAHQLILKQPLLKNSELERIRKASHTLFNAETLDITWPVVEGAEGMLKALDRLCKQADECVNQGVNILILSDRSMDVDRAPIPSLLAVGAVHHHLVREGVRLRTSLVLESGEPREVHHFATLLGYGVQAINPYLMFESLDQIVVEGEYKEGMASAFAGAHGDLTPHDQVTKQLIEEAESNIVKAVGKGLLKVISKIGISTIHSYTGAQIFEAVGLQDEVIDRCFAGTASRVSGVGFEELAQEALNRHLRAYPERSDDLLPPGGVYYWRRDGEAHMWNPDTIAKLQHSVRSGGQETYDEYAKLVNEDATKRATLRGLFDFQSSNEPVPLDEVEPAAEIVKRFATGAMSLGSISTESHETLAVAMNRIGGKSNTGEGGEDPRRFEVDENGDLRRSAIKQVASGRFGVTIHYLVNADELQIKVAQGAKPGEGGQLPGHKVDRYIGSVRHTTPGVGLISPPPHHDIYSIEDLKQLIYDLRCSNPTARVSVKLVSEVGVGTVAAGVAKANSDHVVIAGHDGGTGASPLSSIQGAGVPWEIGLAETQQTLLKNDLRSRIFVQTDGQLKTGRDVVMAALLGADEMGFSTAPLIATGCIMMRACHLNTCPVGIATQDPELRKRFEGKPEHVVNFCFFVAEEARKIMAQLGVRKFEDLIGRTEYLKMNDAIDHWKARGVDLSGLLKLPEGLDKDAPRHRVQDQPSVLGPNIDWELIEASKPALEEGKRVELKRDIINLNLTTGGILSGEIARRKGIEGLPEDSINVEFKGSAGQSFGCWLAPGVTFTLHGDANDYTGKGLSGGVLTVTPPAEAKYVPEDNVIIGNTVLYGATNGRAFFRGLAGERFAVRNSGASAVVEGVGDHGCEYMTGGRVVVLGETGRNFAAGMSGGVAYILDEEGKFASRCNHEMVGLDPVEEFDAIELRELIEEHQRRTGSTVAARVLENFDGLLSKFVKVMPHDYKRVLAELADEAEAKKVEEVGADG